MTSDKNMCFNKELCTLMEDSLLLSLEDWCGKSPVQNVGLLVSLISFRLCLYIHVSRLDMECSMEESVKVNQVSKSSSLPVPVCAL